MTVHEPLQYTLMTITDCQKQICLAVSYEVCHAKRHTSLNVATSCILSVTSDDSLHLRVFIAHLIHHTCAAFYCRVFCFLNFLTIDRMLIHILVHGIRLDL